MRNLATLESTSGEFTLNLLCTIDSLVKTLVSSRNVNARLPNDRRGYRSVAWSQPHYLLAHRRVLFTRREAGPDDERSILFQRHGVGGHVHLGLILSHGDVTTLGLEPRPEVSPTHLTGAVEPLHRRHAAAWTRHLEWRHIGGEHRAIMPPHHLTHHITLDYTYSLSTYIDAIRRVGMVR